MSHEEPHPSDQELVLAADGELPPSRGAAVREHLASCWSCRARMNDIEAAVVDFVRLYRGRLDSKLPPVDGARTLLRARLSSLAGQSETSFGARLPGLWKQRRSYEIAFVALLGAMVVALAIRVEQLQNPGDSGATHLEAAAVPRPQLTPGATVPVTKQQVCAGSSLTEGPVVPASLRRQVFEAYGITNPQPGAYEIDYLITPDLGGTANIRNLWPQPYYKTVWNARVKDQLEERLHTMVCSGEIDLATAQHDLATDWVNAYKKYFRTNGPRSGHAKVHNGVRQLDGTEDYLSVEDHWHPGSPTIRGTARSTSWLIGRVRLQPSNGNEM